MRLAVIFHWHHCLDNNLNHIPRAAYLFLEVMALAKICSGPNLFVPKIRGIHGDSGGDGDVLLFISPKRANRTEIQRKTIKTQQKLPLTIIWLCRICFKRNHLQIKREIINKLLFFVCVWLFFSLYLSIFNFYGISYSRYCKTLETNEQMISKHTMNGGCM